MKTSIDNTLVEATPHGGGARQTIFPEQFIPGPCADPAGVLPLLWPWHFRKPRSNWSFFLEVFVSAPPWAGGGARVTVEDPEFHKYLIADDNRSDSTTAFLTHNPSVTHGSPAKSGSVYAEAGDYWIGKVAFHPPV